MFGQSNNQPDDQIPEHSIEGALNDGVASTPPADDSQADWGHPGVPLDDAQNQVQGQPGPTVQPTDPQPADDSAQPQSQDDAAVAAPVDTPAPVDNTAPVVEPGVTNDLIDIKQKALTQLSPLVGHLDQTPEEKFRTTMMMIQASDNQELIPVAYEAANAIQDEKAKAQALLDIVNEINYFTQHHQN